MKQAALLRSIALMAACVCVSPAVVAGPITYNINFVTSFGVAPTSGSFTFDNGASTFTAFNVVWDGISFDLAANANAPFVTASSPCAGGSGAVATFDALTAVGCRVGTFFEWGGINPMTFADFFFSVLDVVGRVDFKALVPGPLSTSAFGQGSFTVTAAALSVPEPATLGMLGLGLAGIGFARRKRKGADATT